MQHNSSPRGHLHPSSDTSAMLQSASAGRLMHLVVGPEDNLLEIHGEQNRVYS